MIRVSITAYFTDERHAVDALTHMLLAADTANPNALDLKVTSDVDQKTKLAPANHFVLCPAARSLSLDRVLRMSDEEAYRTFQRIRWHERDGEAECPRCGCAELYDCRAERRWKCKDCSHRFSVTSGTIFDSRKMAIRDILAAIAIVANGEKRITALRLSRELDVTYKTALDLAHRLRGSKPRSTGRRFLKSGGRRRGSRGHAPALEGSAT
jgi:transposase-like protein